MRKPGEARGAYLGAVLSPGSPRAAVQVTQKNTEAMFEVSPPLKAPQVA